MNDKESAVEQLYSAYKSNGFITDDEIYDVCDTYNLSAFDTDYVANKILSLGVLISDAVAVTDESDNSELTDYAKLDYTVIYSFFLYYYPELKAIIDISRNTPPVQHGEINRLIEQMRSGNTYAREIIFRKYIRLALKYTYNYREKTSLPLEDIFQEACLSILKAIDSYDPYANSAFTSYCSTWIRQRIDRYIADHESIIRIPVYSQDQIRAIDKLFYECQGLTDVEKVLIIKEHFQLSYNESCLLLQSYNKSLNIFLEDVFESLDDIEAPDDYNLEIIVNNRFKQKILKDLLKSLTSREAQIIELRYGMADGKKRTLEEVAAYFKVTRERIRQIEAKALRKLRRPGCFEKIKDLL